MFLHLSVILFTMGMCLADTPLGRHPDGKTPRADTPQQTPDTPPRQTPDTPPPGRHQTHTPRQTPSEKTPSRADTPRQTPPADTRHPLDRHQTPPRPDTRHTPLGRHPLGKQYSSPRDSATAANGTHPTGMHSCLLSVYIQKGIFFKPGKGLQP